SHGSERPAEGQQQRTTNNGFHEAASSGVPQLLQKRASGSFGVLHSGHFARFSDGWLCSPSPGRFSRLTLRGLDSFDASAVSPIRLASSRSTWERASPMSASTAWISSLARAVYFATSSA